MDGVWQCSDGGVRSGGSGSSSSSPSPSFLAFLVLMTLVDQRVSCKVVGVK